MEEQSYTSTQPLGHTGPVTGSLYLLVRNTRHKVPCYAIFFSLLLFPLPNSNILISIPFSNFLKTEAEDVSSSS